MALHVSTPKISLAPLNLTLKPVTRFSLKDQFNLWVRVITSTLLHFTYRDLDLRLGSLDIHKKTG